jgi:hypothetical protein
MKASGKRRIRLESKRGSRVGRGICSACGSPETALWHYSKSSHGPVTLCSRCKTAATARSSRRIDALDMASGSAFESNRRRH